MSQQLIGRNVDLKLLRDEGYGIEVKSRKYLLIHKVPYVNARREIKLGTLVSELDLAGDETRPPNTHVAYFIGEHPCHADGSLLSQIQHGGRQTLNNDLVVDYSFSAKPKPDERYRDYHHKMETYVAIISQPAQEIDPTVTAKTFPVIECTEEESVFKYADTASSRAGIDAVTSKLEIGSVAIIGVGGTGSYVLDLVAKTPVREIHLFDGDEFVNHNAFRSPGAPSIEELRKRVKKVAYFSELYSKMRRNIFAHPYFIDASNVDELRGMNFVFLCIDSGRDKQAIVEKLEEWGIPFIDVGMGVELVEDSLIGILRVTSSTVNKRGHLRQRVSFADGGDNDYSRNIQIADLNALNAALAVVKWKKLLGFYQDRENEHFSAYTIDGNALINEDQI
ncbi:MAG: ThiF family adenylyltransferase [Acidobacteriota bacterium]|nr:ThiF family adenylyltransferase [Acidobacteriota bacterium]